MSYLCEHKKTMQVHGGNMAIEVEASRECGRWLFKPRNDLAKAILEYRGVESFSEKAIKIFVNKGVEVKDRGNSKYSFVK